jgi:hypothetical protein
MIVKSRPIDAFRQHCNPVISAIQKFRDNSKIVIGCQVMS